MNTDETLRRLSSSSIEEQLAVLREFNKEMVEPEVYPLLLTKLTNPDYGVIFLSLDVLVRIYPVRVQQDAVLLTPHLLRLLTTDHGPIVDRAIWALSITGPDSIRVLLEYIQQSTDDQQLEMGIWALGRNAHIRQNPTIVVNTIQAYLHHPAIQVQIAALCMLMDMSPLRPFQRLEAADYNFESLYPELQTTARALLGAAHETSEWAERYLDLLEHHYKSEL